MASCTFLLVLALQSLRVLCCPDTCSCSNGTVECYRRGFLFIPEIQDGDTHTILLAYNKISALTSLSFYTYPKLKHLELQGNVISNIHGRAFHGLLNLTYLDLSGNQLSDIKAEVFRPLTGLQTLNLGNNRLAKLPVNVGGFLTELASLYLHNNVFSSLQTDALRGLPSLAHLRLDGNPWVCSCKIQNLLSWMLENAQKIKEQHRTLCGVPRYLDQYPVMEIKHNSFRHCEDFFTLFEYLYFLLIGLAMFVSSILLCLGTGCLIICYERSLVRMERKPTVYKRRFQNGKRRMEMVTIYQCATYEILGHLQLGRQPNPRWLLAHLRTVRIKHKFVQEK